MNILEEIPKTSSIKTNPQINTEFTKSAINVNETLNYFLDFRFFMLILLITLVGLFHANQSFKNIILNAYDIFLNFIDIIFNFFGKSLNLGTDVAADVAHTGIDIAEGTLQNVGNLMIGDEAIEKPKHTYNAPNPDNSENNIQKPISSTKTKWCLIGEYENKRGCVSIKDSEKCMSGQVFPNERLCLQTNH
jgi:hypothetical protein